MYDTCVIQDVISPAAPRLVICLGATIGCYHCSGSRLTNSASPNPSSARSSLTLWIWLSAIAVVITGELLPGSSKVLRLVAFTRVSDKLQHFAAYCVLAAIPAFGFERRRGIAAALSMIVLGVALEFLQRLVPGRDFEWLDMAANTLGVLSGILVSLALRKRRPAGGSSAASPPPV